MFTQATKQILSLLQAAEQKKRNLEQYIRSIEQRKSRDENKLRMDEALALKSRSDPGLDTTIHVRQAYEDKKTVMDDEHELAELKRKLADADKKISEIKHWTGQSEFEDEGKRAEAVNQARQTFNAI